MTPTSAINPGALSHAQIQSAIGALIGGAVGDALGAPFEFRPAGTFAARFPRPVLGGAGEFTGGGAFGWAPGEFTDDTQMAVALAESLVEHGGKFVAGDVWERFRAWARHATDIGTTTAAALSHEGHGGAARSAHENNGRSDSNGSLMRIAPVGIAGVTQGRAQTIAVARDQARLTHHDEAASWASAVAAELIRQFVAGASLPDALASAVDMIDTEHRSLFSGYLTGGWRPDQSAGRSNGEAIICLAQAVWCVRTTRTFEKAVTAAVNLGDDADTVAAVTGAIAGALYGMQRIPARWVSYVHGHVGQRDGTVRTYHQHDLVRLAHALLGVPARPMTTPEHPIPPTEVHEIGVLATNMAGATQVAPGQAVVSLCRMEDLLHHHPHRRELWIIDEWEGGHNPHLHHVVTDAVDAIDAFLAEGREVIVHCHGGRSRTGLVLKAWYMRRHGTGHLEADEWLASVWPHYATWNTDFWDFLDNEWGQQ